MYARTRDADDPTLTERIVFVVNNADSPSLLLSFIEPLKSLPGVQLSILTEPDLDSGVSEAAAWRSSPAILEKLHKLLTEFRPSLIVFCRYSGPCACEIIEWARATKTPTIFHVDDDLLRVPREIGESKARYHNEPRRLQTVRYLLDHATLAYCANDRLQRNLFGETSSGRVVSGDVYCTCDILAPPTTDEPPVIGFMGLGSHDHDFTLATPALIRILGERPALRLEIFGSIQIPAELAAFADRIRSIEPVRDYSRFLEKLASLKWTIGICPLAKSDFNAAKSNTKWVEYSASGFAVVATRGTIYDACCAEGRGLLVDGEDEWFEAFDRLLRDKALHRSQVLRAQQHLRDQYSRDRLRRQIASVIGRAHALVDRADVTKLSLDEFDGDRIWGWAWRSTETSAQAQQRLSVELWCGDVLIGRITRQQNRPDVDAYLGAPNWPKGFSAPVGALNALCRLVGDEEGAFHPRIRFGEETIPVLLEDPRWRNEFQTLGSMNSTGFRVADLWWGNSHLLKMRASREPGGGRQVETTLLRLFQPLRRADGGVALTVVDESPAEGRQGVYALGVRNPFMPILLVGYDESRNIAFVDLLPFPSLLRGGLHAAEAAAIDDSGGGLESLGRLSDAYLNETIGAGSESTPPAIGEIGVDLLTATGAEPIFEPQLKEWLALVFGVKLTTINAQRRIEADLGDAAFVEYAEKLLGQNSPAQGRNGRLRLTLPCSGVPTIDALASRRLSAPATPGAAPCLIVDRSFPHRRFFVALPSALSEEIQIAMTAGQNALPALSSLTDEDGSVEQGRPAAIIMRDLGPRGKESILFPVSRDEDIVLTRKTGATGGISVFIRLDEEGGDIRHLLDSLARQRTVETVDIFLLAGRSPRADACRKILEESFPACARVIDRSVTKAAADLNRAAAEAAGETFVFVDSRVILHDDRTLETIVGLSRLQGAGTVGCMLIEPRNATDGAPVFASAGYFPARLDFSIAPHLALEQFDCSALLVDAVYPVAANSSHLYALSAEAWRNAGGVNQRLTEDAMQIDLALRLAGEGRVNICTTLVSAFSEARDRLKYLHPMAVTSHLDLWRLLPALKSSVIIRAF